MSPKGPPGPRVSNEWAAWSAGRSKTSTGASRSDPLPRAWTCSDDPDVGLGRLLVWPIPDEVEQLEAIAADIVPALGENATKSMRTRARQLKSSTPSTGLAVLVIVTIPGPSG